MDKFHYNGWWCEHVYGLVSKFVTCLSFSPTNAHLYVETCQWILQFLNQKWRWATGNISVGHNIDINYNIFVNIVVVVGGGAWTIVVEFIVWFAEYYIASRSRILQCVLCVSWRYMLYWAYCTPLHTMVFYMFLLILFSIYMTFILITSGPKVRALAFRNPVHSETPWMAQLTASCDWGAVQNPIEDHVCCWSYTRSRCLTRSSNQICRSCKLNVLQM